MGTTVSVPRIAGANSPQPGVSKVGGWHFDLVLRIGALADGAEGLYEVQVPLGAPFCLRGIGGYDITGGDPPVVPLVDCFLQFSNQSDVFLQNQKIGTTGDWSTGGENALYEPVYNQMVYGPGSVIQVRVTNDSGDPYTDAYIIFRGTKLYYEDLIYSVSYPPRYNGLPYQFPVQWPPDLTGIGTITVPASTTIRDIKIEPKGSDFVFRGGVISLIEGSMSDIRLLFRDQWQRPYASDFIHWQWLLSNNFAQRPGVFYPEIYIPKDRILLLDLRQVEAATAVVNLVLTGQRVFPK